MRSATPIRSTRSISAASRRMVPRPSSMPRASVFSSRSVSSDECFVSRADQVAPRPADHAVARPGARGPAPIRQRLCAARADDQPLLHDPGLELEPARRAHPPVLAVASGLPPAPRPYLLPADLSLLSSPLCAYPA